MQDLDPSWWNTAGAVALLSGIFTLLGATAGYLARPWVEKRIRQEVHHETTAIEWTERARDLTADLTSCLWGLAFPPSSPASMSEAERFSNDLQRPLLLARRYAPDAQLRSIAADVFDAFRMATSMTLLLSQNMAETSDEELEFEATRNAALEDSKRDLDRMVTHLTPPLKKS